MAGEMYRWGFVPSLKIERRTFDEQYKPFGKYKEAYDAREKEYSSLVEEAGEWADQLEEGSESKQIYDAYTQDLWKAADSFSKGMNNSNVSALLGLKRRNATVIGDIKNAVTEKKKEEERQTNAKNTEIFTSYKFKNPNYNKDKAEEAALLGEEYDEPEYITYDKPTTDMFLHGQKPVRQKVDLENVSKTVGTFTKNLAEELTKIDSRELTSDEQQIITTIKQGGLSREDMEKLRIALTEANATPGVETTLPTYLKPYFDIISNTLHENYYGDMNEENQQRLIDRAFMGLTEALSHTGQQLGANTNYMSDKDKQNLAIQRKELALREKQIKEQIRTNRSSTNENTTYTALGLDGNSRTTQKTSFNGKEYDAVIDDNGRITLTNPSTGDVEYRIDATTGIAFTGDGSGSPVSVITPKKETTKSKGVEEIGRDDYYTKDANGEIDYDDFDITQISTYNKDGISGSPVVIDPSDARYNDYIFLLADQTIADSKGKLSNRDREAIVAAVKNRRKNLKVYYKDNNEDKTVSYISIN